MEVLNLSSLACKASSIVILRPSVKPHCKLRQLPVPSLRDLHSGASGTFSPSTFFRGTFSPGTFSPSTIFPSPSLRSLRVHSQPSRDRRHYSRLPTHVRALSGLPEPAGPSDMGEGCEDGGSREPRSCRVAVVGAGAAGLVTARELQRAGHEVVVFEQASDIGGVWRYEESTESDPLGLNPLRARVHSSLYQSLRTNLPREIMGFSDFPFLPPRPPAAPTTAAANPTTGATMTATTSPTTAAANPTTTSTTSPTAPTATYPTTAAANPTTSATTTATAAAASPTTATVNPTTSAITTTTASPTTTTTASPTTTASAPATTATTATTAQPPLAAAPSTTATAAPPPAPPRIRDPRRYPHHTEVLAYLEDFADAFSLRPLIRHGVRVCRVSPPPPSPGGPTERGGAQRWRVEVEIASQRGGGSAVVEEFDAVVVANGHYSEPRVPHIPGLSEWPGIQLHSHSYRDAGPFDGQTVVVLGAANSGEDVSLEVAGVARAVFMSARGVEAEGMRRPRNARGNVWLRPQLTEARGDGNLVFADGSTVQADALIFCTGYLYSFPFLDPRTGVKVEENRVGPLFQHVFALEHAPGLAFIGLPWKVVPFPLSELQARWVAAVLAGRALLPSRGEMERQLEEQYAALEAEGLPVRYTHNLDMQQFDYQDWLADQACSPRLEAWRQEIYVANRMNKKQLGERYRDHYLDADLQKRAEAYLATLWK